MFAKPSKESGLVAIPFIFVPPRLVIRYSFIQVTLRVFPNAANGSASTHANPSFRAPVPPSFFVDL